MSKNLQVEDGVEALRCDAQLTAVSEHETHPLRVHVRQSSRIAFQCHPMRELDVATTGRLDEVPAANVKYVAMTVLVESSEEGARAEVSNSVESAGEQDFSE